MMHPTTAVARRTGMAAVTAGAFLFLGVGPELLWPVQEPDGSVTHTAAFILYVTCWTVGAVALTVALLGVDGVAPGPLSRAGRIGRSVCLAGGTLLAAFGPVAAVTALVDGAPAEWSFLLFALGMLSFVPGAIFLALGLRRAGAPRGVWVAVMVAAGGVVLALVASADPWHDLGLFGFYVAWAAVGLRLLSGGRAVSTGRGRDRAPVR